MKYGVLGDPIDHSLSPIIFNSAFNALNLDHTYSKIKVSKGNLRNYIESLDQEWVGFSVTMPLKFEALQLAYETSENAKRLGVVNTLYRKDSVWYGENTDLYGMEVSLKSVLNQSAENGIILGSGGTARPAIVALSQLVKNLYIVSRNSDTAYQLKNEFNGLNNIDIDCMTFEELSEKNIDNFVLVNTVPGGVADELSQTTLKRFNVSAIVDVRYGNDDNLLSKLSKNYVNGLTMLLYQACKQFELFFGKRAPIQEMRAEIFEKTGNLISINYY